MFVQYFIPLVDRFSKGILLLLQIRDPSLSDLLYTANGAVMPLHAFKILLIPDIQGPKTAGNKFRLSKWLSQQNSGDHKVLVTSR